MTGESGYLFLVHHDVARPELATALAELLSLPVTAIDVGDHGRLDRNWDRPISCTVISLGGDLRLQLDMYFAAGTVAPPEAEAAARLAARLNTLVAYESVTSRPSAYWLVGPDGQRTRARVDDDFDEDDHEICRIAAVEAPVPLLPNVLVTAIPEVIGEYRMPTPVGDALTARLPVEATEEQSHALTRLLGWESMVARLAAGWHPDGWYPPDHYRDDMELRDRLADVVAILPAPIRAAFSAALDSIDRRFADATVDDGGQALASVTGPVPDRWWWRRITDPLPWRRMPRTISR
ncbi:hypothetical protein [Actinoplanes philippinensis]|uniref:hypothetical protein n=1 Tax=Actinoplanes philippinensis TaxID=35752 RepID=UPI0033C587F7